MRDAEVESKLDHDTRTSNRSEREAPEARSNLESAAVPRGYEQRGGDSFSECELHTLL